MTRPPTNTNNYGATTQTAKEATGQRNARKKNGDNGDDDGTIPVPPPPKTSSFLAIVVFNFFVITGFAICIPTSKRYTESFPGGQIDPNVAGFLVGVLPLTAAIAQVGLISVLRRYTLKSVALALCATQTAASVLYAIAPSLDTYWLAIVGRALQGLSTAPLAMFYLSNAAYARHPALRRRRMMVFSAMIGFAFVAGPAAGLVLEYACNRAGWTMAGGRHALLNGNTAPGWFMALVFACSSFLLEFYFEEEPGDGDGDEDNKSSSLSTRRRRVSLPEVERFSLALGSGSDVDGGTDDEGSTVTATNTCDVPVPDTDPLLPDGRNRNKDGNPLETRTRSSMQNGDRRPDRLPVERFLLVNVLSAIMSLNDSGWEVISVFYGTGNWGWTVERTAAYLALINFIASFATYSTNSTMHRVFPASNQGILFAFVLALVASALLMWDASLEDDDRRAAAEAEAVDDSEGGPRLGSTMFQSDHHHVVFSVGSTLLLFSAFASRGFMMDLIPRMVPPSLAKEQTQVQSSIFSVVFLFSRGVGSVIAPYVFALGGGHGRAYGPFLLLMNCAGMLLLSLSYGSLAAPGSK